MIKVIKKLNYRYSLCECTNCSAHYKVKHSPSDINSISHLCTACCNPGNQTVDQALVKKFFNYGTTSGVLTWRLPTKLNQIGDEVGSLDSGYLRVRLGKKQYRVHRLIWLYQTGYLPEQVDHIDHNRMNNKWDNLREVDALTNAHNLSQSIKNTLGTTGVFLDRKSGKYRAGIMRNGNQKWLGFFDSINDAITARKQAELQFNFHPNHGAIM